MKNLKNFEEIFAVYLKRFFVGEADAFDFPSTHCSPSTAD
jgi:hypothetical protein